ncbi:MAG: insulinase family protein, partial [Candidatus Latescibacteria bacterium]|nr:insulinase family protein [Candidatus Latescibacterota bacterium]
VTNLYAAIGGGDQLNAHTSFEETVYKVGLPSNRLKQWATIEAERFQNPIFRIFQPELETVYEEKNTILDDKQWLVGEAMRKLIFKNHPYGQQSLIGTVEHLKSPSLKDMYWYFNTYYVPNNMAVCISGDIDVDETIQVIDEYFSAWKSKELPPPINVEEPPLKGVERDTVKFQGEEYVRIGFHTVPKNHKDAEALQLLDMILDNRTAGLINLNLVQQQQVRDAGSSPSQLNDYGTQYLYGIPKKDQTLAEVEQLLLDQIEIIKRGEFEDWILDAIITDFKKGQKGGLESNTSRAATLRNAFLEFTDWDHKVAEISRMEKITKADVVRVANQYFASNYAAVYRIDEQHELPKVEKPNIDKIDIDPTRQSEFSQNVLAMPAKEIEPRFITDEDYDIVEVYDGVKLYYSKNPINDLFSFTINIELGNFHDNRLGTAKALLHKSGADTLDAVSLNKMWYRLGSNFDMGVQDQETRYSISGLDEKFEASLELMLQYIKNPKTNKATLNELIKIALAQREDEKKNPRALTSAIRLYSRYGEKSSYKRRISTEVLQKLSVDELHGLVSNLLTYKHALIYVGALPLEQVVSLIKKHHVISQPLREPPAYEFLKAQAPDKIELRIFHKEMAQAQVLIEFGSAEFDRALRPASDLYNEYFSGGFGGIVFQELREARALAYSAFARHENGERKGDQNLMWAYIRCQADKTPEAISAFTDLIDNLPESPERFDQAHKSVVNRYRVTKANFRGVPGVVRIWEHWGVKPDPRKERFEKIKAGDLNLILNFHKNHIQNRPKLISIVGDTTKMNMAELSKIANPIPVTLGDLFVK